jgi:hypothetical protein
VSRRHGELATSWAARLPVRAGVETAALVVAPAASLSVALDALATEPDAGARVVALAGAVLPLLRDTYAAHLRAASPVSEGPVMEVLARAQRELAGDIRTGDILIAGLAPGRVPAANYGAAFEQAFDAAGVFPAVRPS